MPYNFKIALRNLKVNKTYSAINIIGLAVSLAVCSFIFLWIQDEKSYDRFHQDAENIHIAIAHFKSDGGESSVDISSGLFAPTAKQNFGEVESFCRVRDDQVGYLQAEEIKTGSKRLLIADSNFFHFFNFPILKGIREQLLQTPNDVVISESLARELFAEKDPIGKIINVEGEKKYQVAAVMKDFPSNTYLSHADIICPHNSDPKEYFKEVLNSWGSCEFLSFLRLKSGTDIQRLGEQVTQLQTSQQDIRHFTLQPLVNMHLYSFNGEPSGIKIVQMFSWIGLVMLVIACINYVNLVTARSSKRHREIGLKKILGARKAPLFLQLITEAILLFVIALGFAVVLNILLISAFNQLSGKEISFSWNTSGIGLIYGGMFLTIILLAGIYPAISLSSFKSVNLLQGVSTKKSNTLLRKSLVILQFVVSAMLIVGTITMDAQMNYIRQKNLGFDKEHVLVCELQGEMPRHYNSVKTELMKNAAVLGVTGSSEYIMGPESSNSTDNWDGKSGEGVLSYTQMRVDSSFLDVMHIPLAEGQNFSAGTEPQYIINEAAAKAMGLKEPIAGKWMNARGGMRGTIVGVVKDFHFADLHQEIAPIVFYPASIGRTLYVRTTAQGAHQAIASLENLWKQYSPDYTFSYRFMDDSFDQIYRSDIRTGRLFGLLSLIAILISCLGLFGLVTYTAETKTKEIGIRKVLGASVSNIVNMISKEFLILVSIAMLIAFPLSYYWLDKMLQGYAYRTSIGWWMFGIAGLITLLLALSTVISQALKAATANPIESIKTE